MIAKTWNELRDLVGQWSVANFGTQHGLGCIAPLMGIVEEWLLERLDAESGEDYIDAVADALIFFMDYCYRSGIDLCEESIASCEAMNDDPSSRVGAIFRTRLKRIQGIRGFHDDEEFNHQVQEDAIRFVASVNCKIHMGESNVTAFQIACDTFDKVVSKRKWHDKPSVAFDDDQYLVDFRQICKELNRGVPQ